jgi:anaerobic selenocysteine-containing dehydrogenase
MLITIDDNEVVGVAGDADHPFSQGYLCPKGRALGEAHHRHDRLDGGFVRRDG